MQTAYSAFLPEDYPTHSGLIDLMFFSRFPEHPKQEIDQIATLLTAWTAGGQYGKLFDGVTNISLTGKVAHFELGYIPEQAVELKTAVGLLISGFTRQHIITLPRSQRKRIIFEEAARFLDVPGGEKIMGEGYAQLRKFSCWIISIVQQYSKFKGTRIRPVIMGNSKQFFLMRQFDRSDLEDISRDIQLPEVMIDAVQHYPLPEQQPAGQKFSSLCYYSPTVQPPLCGTLRHVAGHVSPTSST
jgi:type IV secretory pathway VirB4 component